MHNNTLNLDFYFYYLMIGIILTGGLSAFLYWQGGRFLMEAFQKDENFARRTNSMLLVGFILLNFGYIFLTANPGIDIVNTNHLFEKLVYRIGIFIIILAVEHTCSLIGLYVIRQRRKVKTNIENSEY
ncbi:MAG: hypothetical protein K1X92_08650 [Bacteroidia bacterium]|nr:hypothetical protein [Bacteroidia bacterium]